MGRFQLYGSTVEFRNNARTGTSGKIKLGKDHLVHPDAQALVQMQSAALAGWWVGLEMLFTLFTREHNAICDALKAAYPEWTDDDLFEHARLVNAGLSGKDSYRGMNKPCDSSAIQRYRSGSGPTGGDSLESTSRISSDD